MARRASPGVGRATIGDNSGMPAHADIRTAVAIELIFEEKAKKLREELKLARKRIESMKINKDDTSFLKGLRDKTGSEIEELFKRQWHLVGAIHQDRYEQLDIFAPKPSAPERRAAHYTMGLLQGLQGKDLEVPPMVVGDDRQQMIDGHNEGRERFDAANTLILGQALDNAAAGKVTDGKTGAAINEKAAADFGKDQVAAGADDPLVVNGERYPTVRQANAARKRLEQQGGGAQQQEVSGDGSGQALPPVGDEVAFWADYPTDNKTWGDEQQDAFRTWFDAQPHGDAPIVIEHAGAQAEFVRLRDVYTGGQAAPAEAPKAVAPKRVVPVPDFHSWDEDWLKWTGPQAMEFRRYFESKPADFVPAITHEGAVAMWRELVAERENKASGGADDEEWNGAAPQRQQAELPDPAETEAAARKLADSGFVAPKTPSKAKA